MPDRKTIFFISDHRDGRHRSNYSLHLHPTFHRVHPHSHTRSAAMTLPPNVSAAPPALHPCPPSTLHKNISERLAAPLVPRWRQGLARQGDEERDLPRIFMRVALRPKSSNLHEFMAGKRANGHLLQSSVALATKWNRSTGDKAVDGREISRRSVPAVTSPQVWRLFENGKLFSSHNDLNSDTRVTEVMTEDEERECDNNFCSVQTSRLTEM